MVHYEGRERACPSGVDACAGDCRLCCCLGCWRDAIKPAIWWSPLPTRLTWRPNSTTSSRLRPRPRWRPSAPTGPGATFPQPRRPSNSPSRIRWNETPATLRIVSHRVGEVLHYGAILAPDSAAPGSLPILMYLHGGDSGVEVDDIGLVIYALGELRDNFVYVIPSFRSEPLEYEDRKWVSTGPGGHWDYDVDDALALLNVALELTPQARIEGLSIVGGSRGAGVALLAGIRDERIENIVAFFGPTDFFDDWVREIAREAAMGFPRDLPGVAHIDSTFIQPYMRGEVDLAEVRLELVRRSSVLFAEDLPAVQLHHGDGDETVAVSQAHSLIRAMEALGREPPEFEAFIYEGGGHAVLALGGAIPRAVGFLRRALGGGPALVAATASR